LVALALTNLLLGLQTINEGGEDLLPLWVVAHLAVTGHGADSWDYATQATILDDSSLPEFRTNIRTAPHYQASGICPYPPAFAVLYAPLGALPFDAAVRVMYLASIGFALVAAAAVARSTDGRLGWLAAAVAVLYHPGLYYGLWIGQNMLLTMALVALGWLAFTRKQDVAAGLWWGLLVYKPPWLFAVAWLPLAVRRPRVWAGMAASAGLLCAVSLFWLGPAAWDRWLAGLSAFDQTVANDPMYREHLLVLGCDLRSVLTRWLGLELGRPLAWTAIAAVAGITIIWYQRRADKASAGAGLLFASGLTAPHLYYYDELVLLLPLLLLWAWREKLTWWQWVVLVGLTAAFYVAIPAMHFSNRWPWPTGPAVALWVFSLTMVRDTAPKPVQKPRPKRR
jgi:hypothetical protein